MLSEVFLFSRIGLQLRTLTGVFIWNIVCDGNPRPWFSVCKADLSVRTGVKQLMERSSSLENGFWTAKQAYLKSKCNFLILLSPFLCVSQFYLVNFTNNMKFDFSVKTDVLDLQ